MRKLLMVGRTRYRLPLSPSLERKFSALGRQLDVRVLASSADGSAGDETFRLWRALPVGPLDGVAFYLTLPFRLAGELRGFEPDAVATQSPFEAVAVLAGRNLARRRPALVVELHGDWRTFSRLYGSPLRRVLAPFTDRVAPWALRRADAVRTLSAYTTGLARSAGVEPAAEFIAFTDLEAFVDSPPVPLPESQQALFVGVLERYKNVENLAAAWRLVALRLPSACLRLVGDGHRRDIAQRLVAEFPDTVSWEPSLSTEEVVRALDASTALLLPSRAEGTPRIVLEAFCRGRAVVGGRVGGVPDVVEDGVSGVLVDPDDVRRIADAIVRVLDDRALAARMGRAARERADALLFTPDEFAERMAALVERAVAVR
jgi:glycosyltransferase involved in cell wall biosynthesis